MKRVLLVLLFILLVVIKGASIADAHAEGSRMPSLQKSTFVYDETGVVSPALLESMQSFCKHYYDKHGLHMRFMIVQFTDDASIWNYLFQAYRDWEVQDEPALLHVLSLGNEKYEYYANNAFLNRIPLVNAAVKNPEIIHAFRNQQYSEMLTLLSKKLQESLRLYLNESTEFLFVAGKNRYHLELPAYETDAFSMYETDSKNQFKSSFTGLLFLALLYVGIKLGKIFGLFGFKLYALVLAADFIIVYLFDQFF